MDVSGDRNCDFHKILRFRDNKEAQKTLSTLKQENCKLDRLQLQRVPGCNKGHTPQSKWGAGIAHYLL